MHLLNRYAIGSQEEERVELTFYSCVLSKQSRPCIVGISQFLMKFVESVWQFELKCVTERLDLYLCGRQ